MEVFEAGSVGWSGADALFFSFVSFFFPPQHGSPLPLFSFLSSRQEMRQRSNGLFFPKLFFFRLLHLNFFFLRFVFRGNGCRTGRECCHSFVLFSFAAVNCAWPKEEEWQNYRDMHGMEWHRRMGEQSLTVRTKRKRKKSDSFVGSLETHSRTFYFFLTLPVTEIAGKMHFLSLSPSNNKVPT